MSTDDARYRCVTAIARGGSGVVHRAADLRLDRDVAMKVLSERLADDPEIRRRFLGEARLTAGLEHPGIVPVYDLGEDERPWFVMKLLQGVTMREAVLGGLSVADGLDVLLRVCDAVAFAHARGVLHRDIKPDNVFLGEFGEVSVMDWGLADAPQEEDEAILGTPAWLAPEQVRAEPLDERTDVYGIGGLLYFLLCGQRLHPGADTFARLRHALKEPVRPPEQVRPGLPAELCRITMRALAFSRDDRYPNVRALRAELDAARRGGWWFATRSWSAGDVLMREGEVGDAAYVLVEGEVDVTRAGRHVRRMGPGECVGELAVLNGAPRSATVTARTRVVARVVTAPAFDAALAETWMGAVVKGLAQRLREG